MFFRLDVKFCVSKKCIPSKVFDLCNRYRILCSKNHVLLRLFYIWNKSRVFWYKLFPSESSRFLKASIFLGWKACPFEIYSFWNKFQVFEVKSMFFRSFLFFQTHVESSKVKIVSTCEFLFVDVILRYIRILVAENVIYICSLGLWFSFPSLCWKYVLYYMYLSSKWMLEALQGSSLYHSFHNDWIWLVSELSL